MKKRYLLTKLVLDNPKYDSSTKVGFKNSEVKEPKFRYVKCKLDLDEVECFREVLDVNDEIEEYIYIIMKNRNEYSIGISFDAFDKIFTSYKSTVHASV